MENIKVIAENYANDIVNNNTIFANLSDDIKSEIKKEIIEAYMKTDKDAIEDSLNVTDNEPDRVDADFYEDDYINEFEAIPFKLNEQQ